MSLKVLVTSFSYKYGAGIPQDPSEHGGGFVFDCRCLPNPGRGGRNTDKTGLDANVREELEASQAVRKYFESTWEIIELALSNYLERGFDHLMISFGCTGGQHRSVYFTDLVGKRLAKNASLDVEIVHQSLAEKGLIPGDNA